MTGRFIAAAVLLFATLAVVDSVIVVAVGRRRRALAYMQNLPADCDMMIEVPKRDGSDQVAFIVCAKAGTICTTTDVPTCTDSKTACAGFQPDSVNAKFTKLYPDAYAHVCEEPSGVLCLYTDIIYTTCGTAARAQGDHEICLPLSNGELECAEIPEEDRQMIQSLHKPAPYQLRPYGRPSRIQQFNREY